jgi:hypothetical protein
MKILAGRDWARVGDPSLLAITSTLADRSEIDLYSSYPWPAMALRRRVWALQEEPAECSRYREFLTWLSLVPPTKDQTHPYSPLNSQNW